MSYLGLSIALPSSGYPQNYAYLAPGSGTRLLSPTPVVQPITPTPVPAPAPTLSVPVTQLSPGSSSTGSGSYVPPVLKVSPSFTPTVVSRNTGTSPLTVLDTGLEESEGLDKNGILFVAVIGLGILFLSQKKRRR